MLYWMGIESVNYVIYWMGVERIYCVIYWMTVGKLILWYIEWVVRELIVWYIERVVRNLIVCYIEWVVRKLIVWYIEWVVWEFVVWYIEWVVRNLMNSVFMDQWISQYITLDILILPFIWKDLCWTIFTLSRILTYTYLLVWDFQNFQYTYSLLQNPWCIIWIFSL